MKENAKENPLLEQLISDGVDIAVLIKIILLGFEKYKDMLDRAEAKNEKNGVISESIDTSFPTTVIKVYYSLQHDEVRFDLVKKSFIKKYIENESNLESAHSKEEKAGLKKMYEFIHSDDVNFLFDIYTLRVIHQELYSCVPYKEFGGTFRKSPARFSDSSVDLCNWDEIPTKLKEINPEVLRLYECAKTLKETRDVDGLLNYLDCCVVLKCQLIKIHPFADGNGRSVRGFINKMFEDAGLPPVYIKAKEKDKYIAAMDLALSKGDYSQIKAFYRYKICDSIIELDLSTRSKKDEEVLSNGGENLVLKK